MPTGSLYNGEVPDLGQRGEIKASEHITGKRAAEGVVPFGRGVVQGTAANQAKVISSAADKFLGIAAHHPGAEGLDSEQYEDKNQMDIVENGVYSVWVEEAVDPNSEVRIRHTEGVAPGNLPGQFRTSAAPGKSALLTGAKFKSSTTGAGRALLDLSGVFTLTADV
jgi:hypothetical protein